MADLINLTGKQFGSWTVLGRAERRGAQPRWDCRCECGVERAVAGSNLRSGASTNCGCKRTPAEKHGHARRGGSGKTRTYRIWKNMISRCHGINAETKPIYARYGGRGISVCKAWRDDYQAFLRDMGDVPDGMTLDRIENDLGYEPGNCRWATRGTQRRNCSRLTFVTVSSKNILVEDAALQIGVTSSAIFNDHRRKGGTIQDAYDRVASRQARRIKR